ncbi:MAG: carboxypeptidase-like regulatory domain-containing protein [Bacteroidetes bacterium]|nr:carboxypeptidase-like regulatory domain-containing protein [Fibrella sp.]
MKHLHLCIILVMVSAGFAQTPVSISGKVTNQLTGEALSYANIQLAGTSIGTTTNQVGEFVFRIPATAHRPVVIVSYLGFQSIEIKRENMDQNRLTIALEPISVNLKEIVIRPIDPWPIVQRSIEKFTRNYVSTAYAAEGFQREHVTSDGNVIQLLEVAFLTKGSIASQSSTVLDARYSEDKKEKASLWNPGRGGFYTFGWTAVSAIDGPTEQTFLGVALRKSSDLTKYYAFTFRKTTSQDGKEIYVIDFDQKKQIRRALLKGTLYIDAESDAIVKVEHEVSPHGLSFLKPHQTWGGLTISKSPKRITVQQDRWVTTYKQYGQKWYLNSVVIDTDFTAALVVLGIVQAQKNSLKLHSERIVTAIDTTSAWGPVPATNIADVGSIPTLQNFIKRQYERYDEVKSTNWTVGNSILSDTATARMAEQLRLNNQRWALETRPPASENGATLGELSTRQLTNDVDYLQESLVKLHPGLTWYTNQEDLDNSFRSVRSKLANINREADFFRLLSPLVEQIHCGHTELYPSISTSEDNALSTKLFPLDVWLSGDTAVVIRDYEGILRGSIVASINKYDIVNVVGKIMSNLPSDGYNQTYKSFRLHNEFPILFDRYVQRTDTFTVKIRPVNGSIKTLRLAGKTGQNQTSRNDQATARVIDSLHSLVITLPSFSTQQDFPAFLQETFRGIKAKGIKNVVIDLRNNQGGRDEYGPLLYAYLTNKPFRYYDRITVASTDSSLLNRLSIGDLPLPNVLPTYVSHVKKADGLLTYTAHVNLATQQPQPNAFGGDVYILINGGTFSSAAEFAAIVRSNKRAVFIGQETGGGYYGNCSLATPVLTLPNSKIRLAIPLAKYELAVSHDVSVGHGIVPDHPTTYYSGDILSNQDKDLNLCLDLIKKVKN